MSNSGSSVLSKVGRGIDSVRRFVVNALFIVLLLIVIAAVVASCESIKVPDNGALLVNPRGIMVERAGIPDPFEGLLPGLLQGASALAEVELQTVLDALEHARDDDNIRMAILNLDELVWSAPAHGQRIGQALQAFKDTGKKVVAYGHFFSQHQYHIASFADALYMHPQGQLVLEGYGTQNFYFQELLEKFDVNVHVFRVGTYKSAVEPLLRNDMSEEARMAFEALYQNLWQRAVEDIATNRRLEVQQVHEFANNFPERVAAAGGDIARTALENHLVDELLTRDQARVRMGDDVGFLNDSEAINAIDFQSYLQARRALNVGGDKIAVLTAQGVIVNHGRGNGIVAAEQAIDLIRQAKSDPAVKALVLRVDSPGGSQFASELIRQELELLQLAGKPVVASFGATAASGGYWISATAERIVAEPSTLTGSIGVFSYLTTFENSLAKLGVHSDGVGTTPLTLAANPISGINEAMASILQTQVEHGYEQFINTVARGRSMTTEDVREVAEGRVWSGEVALELGLIDALGGIDTALKDAAELAGISDWDRVELTPPVDPRTALLARLFSNPSSRQANWQPALASRFLFQLRDLFEFLQRMDDPLNLYAMCGECLLGRR